LILLLAATLGMAACAPTALSGTALPGSALASFHRYFVEHRDGDNRDIHIAIRDELRRLGLDADAGAGPPDPSRYDAIVTYVDRYAWDISMYCIRLTLYIRDARTGYITATGSSWRPSMVRKTPAGHARLVLAELFPERRVAE
jgi:hypothetical protein